MNRMIRKVVGVAVAAALVFSLSACGAKASAKSNEVTIAYQNGISYGPLMVAKELGLVEKYAPNATVTWTQLNSGSAINEGMTSGDIQFGAMGISPAITAVASGMPVKIASGLAAQPHALMTNDPSLNSLSDITSTTKIAVVNLGSFQHILLAMASEAELGDAHALDTNIVAMSNPDGRAALESGTVDAQVASSSNLEKELANSSLHEINAIDNVWPAGNTHTVLLGATDVHDKNPELYNAICKAVEEACELIESGDEKALSALASTEEVDVDTVREWFTDDHFVYSTECKGVMQLATFMDANDFTEKEVPTDFSALSFDNVKGN